MKKLLGLVFICVFAILFVGIYYYYRWKPLWSLQKPKAIYSISQHHDDTLRIVMIGDSWVEMRTDSQDVSFQSKLSDMINKPVIFKSKGKGGEKSHGIYLLMFQEKDFGTKRLLIDGANYCVVIAGINDAATNLGKKQFIYNMKLIIEFLLANSIRPVVVEIPDVNIWNAYRDKPNKDLIVDFARSMIVGCGMYHVSEYRMALLSMLLDNNLMSSVLYIPIREWNDGSPEFNKDLFLSDQIHLNRHGYAKLDSCIIDFIQKDLMVL